MADVVDQLAEFEEYRARVLPKIRQLLAQGHKADDLYKKFKDDLAARKLTIALSSPDEGMALAAIKDITDRMEGKPIERKQLEHKYEKLNDEQLDALLLSEMGEMDELDESAAEAAMESGAIPPFSDSEN
jgi:hypothetical protein